MVSGNRKLNVALVSPYPRAGTGVLSGVEGVVAALAGGLARFGVETHVVTCAKGISKPEQRTTESGAVIHAVPTAGRLGWLLGFPSESRWIRSVLNSVAPDIVHCHTQTLYAYAALERGRPSVLTIHGLYSREAALMRGWRRVQGAFLARFERDALRRAKNVVCINDYIRDELGNRLHGKNVRLIENPVDDRFFGVPDGGAMDGQILYAGSVINRKNLLTLLETLSLLVGRGVRARLRVAGSPSTEPEYYARCKAYVEQKQLESCVDFLGVLSLEAMLEELVRASVVALTSLQETAPMIVSEAMAAARPVVATPAGGTAKMIADGESGFIVPFNDPRSTADVIEKLLRSPELRRDMGMRARCTAETRHRLSVVVGKTVDFYRDILSERK